MSDFNGLPAWIKAVALVWFPIGVALYFMAMFAGVVPSPLTVALAALRNHVEGRDPAGHVLRQICRNTAQNDAAYLECDR